MDRRQFLRAAGTATLGVSIVVPASGMARRWSEPAPRTSDLRPAAFLRIAADGSVTIWAIRLEMGQGVRTALPMIVAEELEVDWTSITVEQAQPHGVFENTELHTGGSSSVPDTYRPLRIAGAAAREMLVTAAAVTWGVPVESCRAQSGYVMHDATGQRLPYGALVDPASRLPVPRAPALKRPSDFRILGKPVKRIDGPAIVTGRAIYGLDIHRPGMVYASIERAPTLGARVKDIDDRATVRTSGVIRTMRVTSGLHHGVAVIARDSWAAMRGREQLRVEWTSGHHATFDSDRFAAEQARMLETPPFKVREVGNVEQAMRAAARHIEGTYFFPFQAHAPVETMNCTADVQPNAAAIWAPTQTDVRSLAQAIKVTGLPKDRITLHCTLVGGGFGRRLFADYVAEAVELSKALRQPVQVLWTRRDDMRHGYFQPMTTHRFRAGLSAGGDVLALAQTMSIADLTVYDIHGGKDIWNSDRERKPENAFASPNAGFYDFPAFRIDAVDATSPVPTGPWRAVQAPAVVFARESFIDELAHAAGKDPIAFRIERLPASRARLAHVLEELRRRTAWGSPVVPIPDRLVGRGVAASIYDGTSFIAMMAEVSLARDLSDLRVTRIVTVVDCGIVLNPLGADGQTESAVAWGLSATLGGKIDFRRGAAVQSSYADFPVLRMDRMPTLETVFVESGADPSGYGEHPVPLVAPAVANAVFVACGKRVRQLPIRL